MTYSWFWYRRYNHIWWARFNVGKSLQRKTDKFVNDYWIWMSLRLPGQFKRPPFTCNDFFSAYNGMPDLVRGDAASCYLWVRREIWIINCHKFSLITAVEIEWRIELDFEIDSVLFDAIYHRWCVRCGPPDMSPASRAPIARRYRAAVNFRPNGRQIGWVRLVPIWAFRMAFADTDRHVGVASWSFDRSISFRWSDRCARNYLCPVRLEIVQLWWNICNILSVITPMFSFSCSQQKYNKTCDSNREAWIYKIQCAPVQA